MQIIYEGVGGSSTYVLINFNIQLNVPLQCGENISG